MQKLPDDENIQTIAEVAHEVNKSYCETIGDNSQPHWADAPDWQKQSAIAGVKAIWANRELTPEQSHESWMEQKIKDGWKWGKEKNAEKKEHPCLVRYEFLNQEQRTKDHLFTGVVKAIIKIAERD